MRIQEKSNKDAVVIVASVVLIVGLFVFLQKYENKQFHREVTPKMFSQTAKVPVTRQMASVEE